MTSSKQLCVLLPILLVTVVIINQASADKLEDLIKRFVEDFQQGGLVERRRYMRTQFAIVAFLPDEHWENFQYQPSLGKGEKPVINPSLNLSPPGVEHSINYLAARPALMPDKSNIHAEKLIVAVLDDAYEQYKKMHGSPPNTMLLYSWIVPCLDCTELLVKKLNEEKYQSITNKYFVYTTDGKYVSDCKCETSTTTEAFNRINFVVRNIRIWPSEEKTTKRRRTHSRIEDLFARLMLE